MSTSNPFGKLKIERDEEDREEMAQQKKSTGEGNQLFAPIQGEQKKKKKVRQEKKETIVEKLSKFFEKYLGLI